MTGLPSTLLLLRAGNFVRSLGHGQTAGWRGAGLHCAPCRARSVSLLFAPLHTHDACDCHRCRPGTDLHFPQCVRLVRARSREQGPPNPALDRCEWSQFAHHARHGLCCLDGGCVRLGSPKVLVVHHLVLFASWVCNAQTQSRTLFCRLLGPLCFSHLQVAGSDISHWFDEKTQNVKT